jgi:hypothetical protein
MESNHNIGTIEITSQVTDNIVTVIVPFKWPALTLDEISVSLGVISSLKQNSKLEIVDEKFLAADNSYAFLRYMKGDSRYKTISFMKHLLLEIKRCMDEIKENIMNGDNLDENISKFTGIIYKLPIFLEAYHYIADIYESSSVSHVSLKNIGDDFMKYYNVLLQNLILESYCISSDRDKY